MLSLQLSPSGISLTQVSPGLTAGNFNSGIHIRQCIIFIKYTYTSYSLDFRSLMLMVSFHLSLNLQAVLLTDTLEAGPYDS